ncbi:MAG: response regulator [Alphaproteobacteria bacterium]|nr:response regulator [Alphaproteobacteria bacterium]
MLCVHIIEDDSSVRDALAELLTADGRPVRAFESPQAFLEAPPPGPDDIVVLDLHFPDGSGVEVAKLLKRDFPGVKIIVVSGVRAGLLARALIAIEPAASFRKPIDAAAFAACIKTLAARA